MLPEGSSTKEFIDNNYNLNHEFDFNYNVEYLNYENGQPYIYLIINYIDFNSKFQIQSQKIFFKEKNAGTFSFSHKQVVHGLIK